VLKFQMTNSPVQTLILGTTAFISAVGDSSAVLGQINSSGNCIAVPLTNDHKPNRPDERARIEAAGGVVLKIGSCYRVASTDYEARCKRIKMSQCTQGGASERPPVALAVSRAFGDREFKEKSLIIATPETRVLQLDNSHQFIFMACDGVWDVMSDQEVVSIVSGHVGNPNEASSAVVTTAFQRGSQDNLTAITIFFEWPEEEELKSDQQIDV